MIYKGTHSGERHFSVVRIDIHVSLYCLQRFPTMVGDICPLNLTHYFYTIKGILYMVYLTFIP